ncbi:MAG: hypothetical protein Q8L81_04590 [Bacteroidota bacterium]|nr:hypothetical protein [Bacteroidota bacterium]
MARKLKIFLLLFSFSYGILAQKPFKQELWWSVWHPFAALKVKKIHKKVSIVYNANNTKLLLDGYTTGGRLDAFRHAFFMAAFAQKIKIKKLRKLGIAHEKGNYRQFLKRQSENGELPDSLGSVMDLANNELGFKIGSENKKKTLEELKGEVIKEINNGKALVMKRANGSYVDCNNKIIDSLSYKGKWFVPKCLVPSK